MNGAETITGLRLLLGNATLQVQGLLDQMTVGAKTTDQARIALNAVELAQGAIETATPVLRKMARKPRGL